MDPTQTYARLVAWLGRSTGLSDDVLQIHAGLAILVLARVLTRRPLGSFVPFAVVAAAEAVNELFDRLQHGSWRWSDTAGDVVNTLLWPLAISLAVRLRPARGGGRRRR